MKFFCGLRGIKIAAIIGFGLACLSSSAIAADNVSFGGKTITMTIGFGAGGGVDSYGRLVGDFMVRHLPGKPALVVLNQPGAGGMVAAKSWEKKAKPDGLSILMGAQSQADPQALFRTKATFKPTEFKMIGGVAAPSQGLFLRKDAVARLTDKSRRPVVMGAVGSTLRSGNYQVMWGVAFLGWNVKWVKGYSRTSELRAAIERNEIDMSSFGSTRDINYLLNTGTLSVVSQSGTKENGKAVARDILGNAPVMADMLQGKIKDPLALRAFEYGETVGQVGKWLALPSGTPDDIVAAYVKAFNATLEDPGFKSRIKRVDPDSPLATKADLEAVMRELAKVSPDVMAFINKELDHQGFGSSKGKKKKKK